MPVRIQVRAIRGGNAETLICPLGFGDIEEGLEFPNLHMVSITQRMIFNFVANAGDHNPLFIKEEEAAKGPFGRRTCSGRLLGDLAVAACSLLFSVYVPCMSGERYLLPVFPGDALIYSYRVAARIALLGQDKKVMMVFGAVNQHGQTVIEGDFIVSPPDKAA